MTFEVSWSSLGSPNLPRRFPYRDGIISIEQADIDIARQCGGDPWVTVQEIRTGNGVVTYQLVKFDPSE